MTYEPNNDDAIQALDDYVLAKKDLGFAVISPSDGVGAGAYAVTVNSGNLDASDTLSVGAANDEALFDGSTVSLSGGTNVQINSVSDAADGTEQYRYDVIWIDSNGEVNKNEGSVVKLSQEESDNNLTRFQRFKGAIPKPGTDPATVIAAVVVNSNDTSVGTSQLKDYRVDAKTIVNALETNDVSVSNVAARSRLSADKTIPTTTATQLEFDNLSFDEDGYFLTDGTIEVNKDGTYLITSKVRWDGSVDWSSGDACQVQIYYNGNRESRNNNSKSNEGREVITDSVIIQASAGDIIETRVFQNSGSDQTVSGIGTDTFMQIARLG